MRPEIKVIGVQTNDSDAMAALGARPASACTLADVGLFSDGTAVKLVGEETFRLARELVDDFVVVDTDAVCAAIKDVFQDTRSILEPAGALGVAGDQAVRRASTALQGETLRRDHLRREHELRPPALRRRARRGRRGARGAVRRDDPRGARQLPALLRAASAPRNVTEFNYRISDAREAHVFVGLADRRPRRVRARSPRSFARARLRRRST